jgi:hypothetical protein
MTGAVDFHCPLMFADCECIQLSKTGTQSGSQRPSSLGPTEYRGGITLRKSVVGVTGFEPAIPTSRRLWEDVPIRRGDYRPQKGGFGMSLGLTNARCASVVAQNMAGYGCIYGRIGI